MLCNRSSSEENVRLKEYSFKWKIWTFSFCISALPLHKFYIGTSLDINHNNLSLHQFKENWMFEVIQSKLFKLLTYYFFQTVSEIHYLVWEFSHFLFSHFLVAKQIFSILVVTNKLFGFPFPLSLSSNFLIYNLIVDLLVNTSLFWF